MNSLLELAERCEKATGPDRELDAEAWAHHMGARLEWRGSTVYVADSLARPDMWFLFASIDPGENHRHFALYSEYEGRVPRYTFSLDAALSLVPEGMILRRYVVTQHVPNGCEVGLDWAHGGWIGESDHSFALALTAAALRARATQVPA